MNNLVLGKNHYSIKIGSEVREICKPFFEQYGISHFCYLRLYNNGSSYTLISNKDLYQHHLSCGYLITPNIDEKQLKKKFFYIVMPELEDGFSQAAYDYKEYFGLNYPIYLIERNKDYFDLCVYGCSDKSAQAINFYLSNLPLLENFKFLFQEKAESLIKQSQENKIFIPPSMRPNFHALQSRDDQSDLNPKKYLVEIEGRQVKLTAKQVQLIKYISQGFTAKEIGRVLSISHRTVESNWGELKANLGFKRKSEVIKKMSDLGIL